jgi:hypothetical protein
VFLVGWVGLSAGKCWWERESGNKWAAETCVEILGIPLKMQPRRKRAVQNVWNFLAQ